jgi:hypothetical protein
MIVEIRAEAAQFPEKEYTNGIAVAVHGGCTRHINERCMQEIALCKMISQMDINNNLQKKESRACGLWSA